MLTDPEGLGGLDEPDIGGSFCLDELFGGGVLGLADPDDKGGFVELVGGEWGLDSVPELVGPDFKASSGSHES